MRFQGGPGSLFRPAGSIFNALVRALSLVSMFGTVLMLAMVSADIAGRIFFDAPLPGVPEFVRLMIVCIVFLQLAYTVELGQLIRSESLLWRLTPKIRGSLDLIYDLIGACALAGIFIYSWNSAWYSWTNYETTPTGFVDVPVFPVRIIVLVGSGMTSLRFIANAFLAFSSSRSKSEAMSQGKMSDD